MSQIITRTFEFFGMQATVFFCGFLIAYAMHVLFDMTAESAAQMVFTAQVFVAGFVVRGWFDENTENNS